MGGVGGSAGVAGVDEITEGRLGVTTGRSGTLVVDDGRKLPILLSAIGGSYRPK